MLGVLQTQLSVPYRRDSWWTILPNLLPRLEPFIQPVDFPLTTVREREIATGRRQIGVARVPDSDGTEKRIAIYEIDVAENVDLPRNRVSLRELVARSIDQANAHAVLAFFVQPGRDDYRLTYAARESSIDEDTLETVTRETAPKRFTFLLGPSEPCRTAAQRLGELAAHGASATFSDVEQAFSVERLNKEFFKKYKEHYQKFVDYLIDETDAPKSVFGITVSRRQEKEFDKACKPVRDFVKRLLGRIVFLHFLQRKGWLGCDPKRRDWIDGDREFMLHYFQLAESKGEADEFHSQWLAPLFFNALNTADRPRDIFEATGTRIPYLNGGLFEETLPDASAGDFPTDYFRDLLEFFAQYNFTIDENDPEEHEIGIDPEMLGHIFENLIEDNKDKGTYYTPKPVVQYMCQQSLIHYLCRQFPGDQSAAAEVERLIQHKEPIDAKADTWLTQNLPRIEQLLDEVKICDPAIGSGAFPIGLLQEIYWTKLTLHPALNRAEAKRAVIQRSIHGVDIDGGAVEIARLRCWLALIVEETEPVPLPNLDYQIMQGNSLLESFEGERLDDLSEPLRNFGRQRLGTDHVELDLGAAGGSIEFTLPTIHSPAQHRLALLRTEYFTCHEPGEKRRLRAQIDAAVLEAIDDRFALRHHELSTALEDFQRELARKRRLKKEYEVPARKLKQFSAMEAELAALDGKKTKLHALLEDPRAERPFFLWHLWFRQVLAAPEEGHGGFDIVIANPPYVRMEGFKEEKETFRDQFESYSGRADLFVYFYEQGFRLLRPGGVLSFITSNKYFRAVYGEKLRRLLTERSVIHELVDFGDSPVFDATAYPSIIHLSKLREGDAATTNQVWVLSWRIGEAIDRLAANILRSGFLMPQEDLRPEGWTIRTASENGLLNKMRTTGCTLNELLDGKIYYGVKTGLNDAFVIDDATRNRLVDESANAADLIKPFYRGRDLNRWTTDGQRSWLIYTRKGTDITRYPSIENFLLPFRTALKARATKQAWYELQQAQYAYASAFEAPKIVYPDIYEHQSFAWDESGAYLANTCYFLPTDKKWLLALLNSRAVE